MPSFHKYFRLINILPWMIALVLCDWTKSTNNLNGKMHPMILHEIYQVAKSYGFNHTFEIDRPYIAFIRNQADIEDVSKGSTMNSCFFTGVLYIFGKVPPLHQSDVQEALKWLRKAAFQGHTGAQCSLGILYYHGTQDVARDRQMAMRLFHRAAASDSASRRASWLLARSLYEGIGADTSAGYNNNSTTTNSINSNRSDKTLDEITRLLIVAADVPDGDDDDPVPEALHLMGVMCEYGHIGWDQLILYGMNTQYSRFKSILLSHSKSHYALAVDLYHRAVELDYAESMYHLGLMYTYGRGVQLNYAKAIEYFRQAALEHYHAASMRYLALFAFKGYGHDDIDFDMAQYFFRQCIAWSDYSAISLKGDGNNEENWIRQLCTTELEEATKWFNKSQQLRIELQKNWSIEASNMI